MSVRFNTVTVIGVGLLGGSLGLALRERGLAGRIRGVGHRRSSLDAALRRGAIDTAHEDLAEGAADADLIVVCTPAAVALAQLAEIRAHCRADAVVTDVASTKSRICAAGRALWPEPSRFVGGHPMAGSEKHGPEHAVATLYEGSVTFVEPAAGHDPHAYAEVRGLWEALGSRTVEIAPDDHDAVVARTSHIPHIAAACLALLAAEQPGARAAAGGGFRDTTRVAAGRPEIWRDICLTNAESIGAGLEALSKLIAEAADAIGRGDAAALAAFFQRAGEARRQVTEK